MSGWIVLAMGLTALGATCIAERSWGPLIALLVASPVAFGTIIFATYVTRGMAPGVAPGLVWSGLALFYVWFQTQIISLVMPGEPIEPIGMVEWLIFPASGLRCWWSDR